MKELTFIDKRFNNYFVTTCGKILKKNKNGVKQLFKNKITPDGYPTLYIKRNNMEKGYSKTIHRIVALAFIPNLDNKETVDHIDNIKTNNSVLNLMWATRKEQLTKLNYREIRGMKVDCFKDGVLVKTYPSIKSTSLDGFNRRNVTYMVKDKPYIKDGREYFIKTIKGHTFKFASVTTIETT